MNKRTLIALFAVSLCASLAVARNGVVRTKDGRSIEGDIADKGEQGVSITTKAGSVSIAREDVASVDYYTDINEAYKARLARLPKDPSARDHIDLARWLYEQKAYDLARQEVDAALRIDPNNSSASLLRQTIDHQILLDQSHGQEHARTGTGSAAGGGGSVAVKPGDRKLLNPDQINIIRQHELRETDTNVRVRFENNVERRFVDYDSQDARQFAAKSPFVKAVEILQRGKPEMANDVRILSDPRSIADFKTHIQPMILTGCATTACHGGTKGGNFLLYAPADNDAVTYTNFLILNRYSTFVTSGNDRVERKAIDRVYPTNSLLAQYGLPRATADYRHPEVPVPFNPLFKGSDDVRYRQLLAWMGRDLITHSPDYERLIDYTLPQSGKPATQPAPAPAAQTPPPADNRAANNSPTPRQQAQPNNGTDDTRSKLDEARRRLRPTGGANSVPSPF